MAYVQIGVIYDETDQENPLAIDGWHVDSLEPIEGAEAFLIDPSQPRHQFAGVEHCFKYKFDSKEQADEYLPAEG